MWRARLGTLSIMSTPWVLEQGLGERKTQIMELPGRSQHGTWRVAAVLVGSWRLWAQWRLLFQVVWTGGRLNSDQRLFKKESLLSVSYIKNKSLVFIRRNSWNLFNESKQAILSTGKLSGPIIFLGFHLLSRERGLDQQSILPRSGHWQIWCQRDDLWLYQRKQKAKLNYSGRNEFSPFQASSLEIQQRSKSQLGGSPACSSLGAPADAPIHERQE